MSGGIAGSDPRELRVPLSFSWRRATVTRPSFDIEAANWQID